MKTHCVYNLSSRSGLITCGAVLLRFCFESIHAASGITIYDVAPVGRIAAFAQPIVWASDGLPTDDDTSALAAAINVWHARGEEVGREALELFIDSYTNSAWTPSLRSQLGKYYRERGRYTLALEHWEQAWAATQDAADGPAKEVADFTLAHYTRLLASLGRLETLEHIFAQTYTRTLDLGPLQQIYHNTFEAMFRCTRSLATAIGAGL